MFADYFRDETAKLSQRCLADIATLDDWKSKRDKYRAQLHEMLGLAPLPERTDLQPVITGKIEKEDFTVEKLHFQSLPGLYVTANLYLPKNITKPAPAILYVCGHGQVKKNGVSYGNKVAYQHHGIWYARNGYVCLIIDTIQLGEIEGIHHGTHREGMWWWNSRGYTPAGVEAWNGIRALDYLETRPEVDKTRFGLTGRSGGGAYSWWIAACDERIKAAAPTAGITDLQNHVVDGVVQGHCDCMFMVNTYRWDYAQVAALVAPRPLLVCNSDKDPIFPLDGVTRLYEKVKKIYALHRATNNLGLLITEGPHKDTPELQVPVFRWFNHYLKGVDAPIGMAAVKMFEPEQLKVFDKLPIGERTSKIHDTFIAKATSDVPAKNTAEHEKFQKEHMLQLWLKSFGGWPDPAPSLNVSPAFSVERDGVRFTAHDFDSQPGVRLRFFTLRAVAAKEVKAVRLHVLDEPGWSRFQALAQKAFNQELTAEKIAGAPADEELDAAELEKFLGSVRDSGEVLVSFPPRGVGPTALRADEKYRVHVRRRFMLLGQTLDGMRVWDVRRAIQAVRSLDGQKDVSVALLGANQLGGVALYAALFEPEISEITMLQPPAKENDWPDFLNVQRILPVSQAVDLARDRFPVNIVLGK
ncbi:MAG: acetylxylan esterase [Verrucomicrobia bacterium]|nr:acetylxylan esterase [Verrucomicrobiota bacterium]